MFKMIRQFTFHHPKQILAPTLWLFLSQSSSILPAILAYMAIYLLGQAFYLPYTLDISLLTKIAIIGLGYVLLQYAVELISCYNTYGRAYHDTADKRIAYIQKLRRQSLGFFSSKESGELISSFASDFANVEYTMCFWLPYPIGVGFLLLLSFVCMLFFDWRMAVAIFAMLPVCAILMLQIAKVKEKHSLSVMEAKTRAAQSLPPYRQRIRCSGKSVFRPAQGIPAGRGRCRQPFYPVCLAGQIRCSRDSGSGIVSAAGRQSYHIGLRGLSCDCHKADRTGAYYCEQHFRSAGHGALRRTSGQGDDNARPFRYGRDRPWRQLCV